jgi:hypothetical protein
MALTNGIPTKLYKMKYDVTKTELSALYFARAGLFAQVMHVRKLVQLT